MKRKHFIKEIEKGFDENLRIIRAKNSDYGGKDDAFLNFRLSEALGIPVEKAILVRMSDKLARISVLLDKDADVKDETVSDTLSDLANYAMILKVFLEKKDT